MKREDLKAIEGLTEEQINAVMRLHGLDAAAHQATVQGLQAQLATAQQDLAAFDGVDVNDLRSRITNLTNQLSQQAAEFAFNGVLRAAAHEAGALDENDAIALLPNRATLCESKNQAEDVKQAFADLKSRKPYLFQQGAPAPQDGAGPRSLSGGEGRGVRIPDELLCKEQQRHKHRQPRPKPGPAQQRAQTEIQPQLPADAQLRRR